MQSRKPMSLMVAILAAALVLPVAQVFAMDVAPGDRGGMITGPRRSMMNAEGMGTGPMGTYHAKVSPAERQAAADRAAAARAAAAGKVGAAREAGARARAGARGAWAPGVLTPGAVPDYFGTIPNFANSPLPITVASTDVVIADATGTGAAATATVSGGVVTGITVLAGGTGYSATPPSRSPAQAQAQPRQLP